MSETKEIKKKTAPVEKTESKILNVDELGKTLNEMENFVNSKTKENEQKASEKAETKKIENSASFEEWAAGMPPEYINMYRLLPPTIQKEIAMAKAPNSTQEIERNYRIRYLPKEIQKAINYWNIMKKDYDRPVVCNADPEDPEQLTKYRQKIEYEQRLFPKQIKKIKELMIKYQRALTGVL